MKTFYFSIVFFLLCSYSFSQNEEQEFTLVQVVNVGPNKFDFKVKSEDNSFKMIICKNNSNCSEEFIYLTTADPNDFFDSVIIQINTELSENYDDTTFIDGKSNDDKVKAILEQIKNLNEQNIRQELTEVQNVLRDIDTEKDKYSGQLVLLNNITNFRVNKPSKWKIERYFSHLYNPVEKEVLKANGTSKKTVKDFELIDKESGEYECLNIVNATVAFFNNKASTISVNAILKLKNGKEESLEFYNGDYSIPLRAFTYYGSPRNPFYNRAIYSLKATTENGNEIEVHINDIFDYRSFGDGAQGNFGFSIANQRYFVSNEDNQKNTVKVVQRRFFDFFTGVIHSDLMGLNTNSSNSLVNAQASILKPMNLGNWAEYTLLRQFRLTTNIALNNSFENEDRYIGFEDTEIINHFDLFRKQNLSTILSLDVFSYESKGWFTTWSLGYNVGFYRTGYQYTDITLEKDNTTSGQLISITHGPYLSFEFRPQDNFGADVMISLDELNLNDDDMVNGRSFSNEIIEADQSNKFLVKHNIVNVSANFYWLTNASKSDGGVYARVGMAYHTPTATSFPQLMVGYATNLTSFVNRFKPKEDDDSASE